MASQAMPTAGAASVQRSATQAPTNTADYGDQEEEDEDQVLANSSESVTITTRTPAPRRTVSIDTSDKTCWICYTTQSEDPSLPFIHPCACTLLAHPDCLLEWISTQQATHGPTRRPHCPACGTAIRIHQDRSEFLRLYRALRRNVDRASLAAGLGGIAASGWFVAAAYGAWALKTFMGEQVTQALLLRHENGLPWRYWLNLPMIPISLILSRTPLIDSLLPFLPLTLVLSTHTHSPYSYSSSPLFDPIGIDDLSLRWPPSPTLTICLLPWMRLLYLRMRYKVFKAVLGRRKQFRGLAGVFEEAAMDEMASLPVAGEDEEEDGGGVTGSGDVVGIVATFEVDPEEEGAATAHDGDQQPQPHQQQRREADTHPAQAPAPPAGESIRLRVGLGRLTSLVLGALLFPALSSLAGSALFWLASRNSSARPFRLLRRLLGVSAVLASTSGRSLATSPTGLSWIRSLFLQAPASRHNPLAVVDPKWVRNSIGAGLVLLTRDAFELLAGVLENRRRASRRIVERPFRPRAGSSASASGDGTGAEVLQGDEDVHAVHSSTTTMSGGQNEHGRPAVVHNYL
ncbi:hypothetical protein JCM10908_007384 [Rhodotorula pacifica]|uniref:uncharacterized protein n=1 Tax=Rhodotorula pacifica TaxID=1495444 RepID=UPI00316DF106